MGTHTNYQPGARGVNLKSGQTLWVEPGQTVDIDDDTVNGELPDFGSKPSEDAAADHVETKAALAAAKSEIGALKAQIAELQSGSKPKLPGLTGKTKDQLTAIAAEEGATVEDGATVNDIISAIELHREAA